MFENGNEDSALLQESEIDSVNPGRIVHTGKVLSKKGSGEFPLYNFKSAAATVAEGRSNHKAIFKKTHGS